MAKRFISSEIWDKDWFLDLPSKYKILWFYLCTKCDVAGVFDPNLKTVSKILGEKFCEAEVLKVFQGKVYKVKDKWVLRKFITFQYGDNISSKMISPITTALAKIGLTIDTVSIEYPYSIDTPIDIEKEIEIEIEKDNNDNKVLINNDNKVFNNDNNKILYMEKGMGNGECSSREYDVKQRLNNGEITVKGCNNNKIKYLDYVYLTSTEYKSLVEKFGESNTQDRIARLNDYGHQKPKKFREYGSHYHTILAWARRDETNNPGASSRVSLTKQQASNLAQLSALRKEQLGELPKL